MVCGSRQARGSRGSAELCRRVAGRSFFQDRLKEYQARRSPSWAYPFHRGALGFISERIGTCLRSPPRTASRSSTRTGAAGQPIVFSHGWPLSADDWDAQMLFFLGKGFRVIAHDRRGHGRSTQTGDGHDMDHYADDLAAVTDASRPRRTRCTSAIPPAAARWSTMSRATAQAASPRQRSSRAVPPLMVKTRGQSGRPAQGGVRRLPGAARRQPRAVLLRRCRPGPFYGFNRPGAKASQAIIRNWWRQGMMGGAKAHYDGIVAFSQTDFTEDLKKIIVPVAGHARRGRPDRALRRLPGRCRRSC